MFCFMYSLVRACSLEAADKKCWILNPQSFIQGADQIKKHQSAVSLALWGEFTGEFPAQGASNAENVSIWWRHHESDGK